ncbi:hypothetical protein C6502_18320 [Candidatus Poribacteria bacterium]|nr:MAG: hypothetical protein C6502_18320 [Candidatus Poribacteria bacterium]
MLEQVSDRIFRWIETHGEAQGTPYRWNSYAIHIPEHKALALVDPLAMTEEEAAALEGICPPTDIILTCEYHLREGEQYRHRWGSCLWANDAERERYNITIDNWFHDGALVLETIRCVFIPAGFYPETALLVQGDPTVLIIGDILSGARCDAGIPEEQLGIAFPEYIPDLSLIRQSLATLQSLEFDILCFGHGNPIRQQPKEKLKEFIKLNEVWLELEKMKEERGEKRAE